MGIQNRGHQLMSRGKLPHISRRASAMSSSVIRTLYSSSDPSKPFNGFAGAPFSRSDSTNSSTARCLSGGNSRSFSSTSSGILIADSVSILLCFPRSGNANLANVVADLQTRAVCLCSPWRRRLPRPARPPRLRLRVKDRTLWHTKCQRVRHPRPLCHLFRAAHATIESQSVYFKLSVDRFLVNLGRWLVCDCRNKASHRRHKGLKNVGRDNPAV